MLTFIVQNKSQLYQYTFNGFTDSFINVTAKELVHKRGLLSKYIPQINDFERVFFV